MRINNNISALNALNNLSSSDSAMSKSLEKLSSGLRINRAADDAAGLAISEKMRNQVKGLNQARRNAQDGISLIQTAEGALNETHSILSRMRELSIQASSDTLTDDDKEQVQKEVNLLIDEIDRISTDTEFNTRKLLNGDASATAKKASGFNDYGQVVQGVKASSVAQAGTYKIKFSNKPAAMAMGTITRSQEMEGEYVANVGTHQMGFYGGSGQNLSSSLTAAGTNNFFGSPVKPGTFFVNDKEVRIEDGDSMYTVLNKINNSGAGVGATIDSATNKLTLYADKDVASNISIAAGTSDFLSVADIAAGTSGWITTVSDTDDNNLLTGATAGTVRLTNLQSQADPDTGDVGLAASDVITISGKVGGQVKTTTFTVGTSTVQDLLANVSNTFGGAVATVERQRASKPANGTYENDFSENSMISDVYSGATGSSDLYINGTKITVSAGDTLQKFLNNVNSQTANTGITAALDRDTKTIVFGSTNNIRMDISSSSGSLASVMGIVQPSGAPLSGTLDVNKIVIKGQDGADNAITELKITATDATGTTHRSGFDGLLTLDQMQAARDKGDFVGVAQLNTDPSDIVYQKYAVAVKPESVNTNLIEGVSVTIGKDIDTGNDVRDRATVTVGQVDGSITLQIGANKGQLTTVSVDDMSSVALGLKSANGSKISLSTRQDAQNSLSIIDAAIQRVSTQRSKLGAFQNRLEHTVTNLGVSSENLTASESRIRDLDMAEEMAAFTKNQILQQAGTAMMAQANQKPQSVMKLLG